MSDLLTLRYPSGDKEFRMSDKAPKKGDVLKRNGDSWVVEEVHEDDDGNTLVTLLPQPLLEPESEDEIPAPASVAGAAR
jgi:hypothetical protein